MMTASRLPLFCCLWLLALFPSKLIVCERLFSLTSLFDVYSETELLATARRDFFSLGATYQLSSDGEELGSAKTRLFSWGSCADIQDEQGLPLASVEEQIFRILPWAEYQIFDETHSPIAHAKMDWLGTCFEIRSASAPERICAILSRPLLRFFRDAWTIEIFDEELLDPRISIFLAVLQTDKDNRDRYRKEIWNQLEKETEQFDGRRLFY